MGKVSSLLFLGFSRIKFFVLFGSANGVNILLKDPGSCELKYLCIKIFELTSSISLKGFATFWEFSFYGQKKVADYEYHSLFAEKIHFHT